MGKISSLSGRGRVPKGKPHAAISHFTRSHGPSLALVLALGFTAVEIDPAAGTSVDIGRIYVIHALSAGWPRKLSR